MGLFSKLFSREGEESTEAEGQDAQAAVPGGENGVTKSEESAAGGGASRDARSRTGGADKDKADASPPMAAGDKHAQRGREAGQDGRPPRAGPPPLEGRQAETAGKPGGKRPAETVKREVAPPAKPPAALGAAQAPARPPVAAAAAPAAPAPDAEVRSPSTQNAQAVPAPRRGIAPMRPATEVGLKGKPGTPAAPMPVPVVEAPVRQTSDRAGSLPLEAAVDAAMAALMDHGGSQAANDPHASHAGDQRAVAETFADMAKVHALPLRELMFQLSVGRTPRHWASACRPVLRPLFDAATQIGLLELVGALGAFDAALERAAGESSAHIGEATAEALTAAYERLRQQMPDAFTPPDRADSRRMILLESLLLQIPTLQRRTLSKLYSAGLNTLGQLAAARPEEISAVAGIDRELALTMVEHVQRFEGERSRINPTALRSHLPDRLRSIVNRLNQLQADFERAEQEDSAAGKRNARNGREAAVLELDVCFAEVGEVDLIEELKRCPVRGKIERVQSYLEQLQSSV